MPQVRLFNPPRGGRRRRRPLAGAALAAHRRRVGNRHGRRRNPRTVNRRRNAGTFAYVANGRRRRRNSTQVMLAPRRRSNPRVTYRYHRRRNPVDIKGVLETVAYITAGGVGTRSLTTALVSSSTNSGATGYAINAGIAVGLGMAAGKFAGEQAGKMVLAGGIAFTAGRIISDYFGQNLITFGQVNLPGVKLSGDPSFTFTPRGMRGDFANVNFPIPYNSTPNNPALAYPPALPAPALVATATASPSGPGARRMAGPWSGGIWGGRRAL